MEEESLLGAASVAGAEVEMGAGAGTGAGAGAAASVGVASVAEALRLIGAARRGLAAVASSNGSSGWLTAGVAAGSRESALDLRTGRLGAGASFTGWSATGLGAGVGAGGGGGEVGAVFLAATFLTAAFLALAFLAGAVTGAGSAAGATAAFFAVARLGLASGAAVGVRVGERSSLMRRKEKRMN